MILCFIWTISIIIPSACLLFTEAQVHHDLYYLVCLLDRNLFVNIVKVGFISINILLTASFYVSLLRHVLRHDLQIGRDFQIHSGRSRSEGNGSNEENANEVISKRDIKVTKNILLLIGIFAVLWLPYVINYCIPGKRALYLYCAFISYMSTIINPIVYGCRNPIFREVLGSIDLCGWWRCCCTK